VLKKYTSQCTKKFKDTKKVGFKWFLILMKVVICIKHCDSIWLEQVCEPCEEFDNYNITIFFFVKWWKSLSNGRWQDMWNGTFKKKSIQMFFGQLIQNRT
jgi:hypothetical protein